ncbi:MAG: FixH family protein [Chlorobiaceae bacterium]|nr:FixH family protein [Chlorobiaceae bacterium]
MKPFIAAIFALFLIAMGCGIFFAYRNAEGLVEANYYERGSSWFQAKAEERRMGLEVAGPALLATGKNEVKFVLTEHGRPLRDAGVKLFVGNVSSKAQDFSSPMRETAPGIYEASAVVPAKGKWLMRMNLDAGKLKTSRSWFFDVR